MLNENRLRWVILCVVAAYLLAGFWWLGQNEGPFDVWVWAAMLIGVSGGTMVILATIVWRQQNLRFIWIVAIMLAGLVFRLAVMPASHQLSDDAARYHWDGKVVAQGINPYLYAPDNPRLNFLRTDAIDEQINHPFYRTCYPPLAQYLFAISYLLSPGRLTGLQFLSLMAELLALLLLLSELLRRQLPLPYLLLAAWCPLIIIQGYMSCHLDVLSLPLIAAFILAVLRGHPFGAGLFLGLACLIKPLPLIFLPAACREFRWRGSVKMVATMIMVMALLYVQFLGAGWRLFSSTWLMATDWSFNGSLGAILEGLLPMRLAHLASVALLGLLILGATYRGVDFLSRALLAQTAYIICTPTLFPWYLIGMYPLLVLRPEPALLALGLLIPFADEVIIGYHSTNVWSPAFWPKIVQYLPFYLLLLIQARLRWGMFARQAKRVPPPVH